MSFILTKCMAHYNVEVGKKIYHVFVCLIIFSISLLEVILQILNCVFMDHGPMLFDP